ncbi:uncharacterized protein ARMOST_10114 [Armillaria ostoyae]|uniref:Uncharacterized protein n=1 Tax=Armillaria ostoyae TaxID=47428 RepID=A0A284RDD9_ARMOS|nr:uncharacterized protein ARMOST_10114 [Armillaria ostoyae]
MPPKKVAIKNAFATKPTSKKVPAANICGPAKKDPLAAKTNQDLDDMLWAEFGDSSLMLAPLSSVGLPPSDISGGVGLSVVAKAMENIKSYHTRRGEASPIALTLAARVWLLLLSLMDDSPDVPRTKKPSVVLFSDDMDDRLVSSHKLKRRVLKVSPPPISPEVVTPSPKKRKTTESSLPLTANVGPSSSYRHTSVLRRMSVTKKLVDSFIDDEAVEFDESSNVDTQCLDDEDEDESAGGAISNDGEENTDDVVPFLDPLDDANAIESDCDAGSVVDADDDNDDVVEEAEDGEAISADQGDGSGDESDGGITSEALSVASKERRSHIDGPSSLCPDVQDETFARCRMYENIDGL